ncbi:MAG: hypothetical protein V4590_08865 [Bacteroidota bacterium]
MLYWYALVIVVAGIIASLFALNGIHNYIVYNIMDVVSLCVYYWGIKQGVRISRMHQALFWIVLVLSVGAIYQSHSFWNAYSSILIYGFVGFSSLVQLFTLTAPDTDNAMELGVFWLLCGFIIYSLSELSLYFLLKHMILDTVWGKIYFRIYNLLVMLVTIWMFTKALLWKTNK